MAGLAHGIDLVDFPRIEDMVQRHGERFLNSDAANRLLTRPPGRPPWRV